MEIRMIF